MRQRAPMDGLMSALYRPIKRQITSRIDADVIEWFRSRTHRGEGYQTRINRALREHIARHRRSASRP